MTPPSLSLLYATPTLSSPLIGCFLFAGFYFDTMEITPPVVGVYRFSADDREVGGRAFAVC